MADLFWFKFSPDKWLGGKIRKEPPAVKVALIELICQYWKRRGCLSVADAKDDVGESAFEKLQSRNILKIEGDNVRISFLDEQLADIEKDSNQARDAANARWRNATGMRTHANALPTHDSAMRNDANGMQRRQEKIRKEKTREEIEIPFGGELLVAWNEWLEYRRERKLPNTPSSLKKQLKFLAGRAPEEIKSIIESSIRNGWQGLFEINAKTHGVRNNTTQAHRTTDAVIPERKDFGAKQGF